MKCAFCPAEAVAECAWPVDWSESISHWDIEKAHVVLTPLPARLAAVRRFESLTHAVRVPVTMIGWETPEGGRLRFMMGRDRAIVQAAGLCGNPVCEAHMVERAERVHYCADHWRSWQEVNRQ